MEKSELSSRRQFLKVSGLAGAASLLPGCAAAAEAKNAAHAKNVIFLVADGLCHGTVGLAHHWKLRHTNTALNWIQLFDQDGMRRAYQDTASASSPVTDSAAAGSSWGCGQRVNNGAINTDPTGKALTPILSYAKKAGKATGLVSTCRITHATPASFATNVASRNDEDAIARQYLEREIDVLLGGGARHFKQNKSEGREFNLLPEFAAKDYQIVKDRSELSAAASAQSRLLGLFSDSHIPYALDRQQGGGLKDVPTLPEMFQAALQRLKGMKDGFVLQVEGGRVDHAGHANDPGAILPEFLEFDACIPIALEFLKSNPDTMLIVTTDHGTGGCQLNGIGDAYNGSGPALDQFDQFKHSFEWLQNRFRQTGRFNAKDVETALSITPTKAQGAIVQAALDDEVKYLSGALGRAFGAQIKELTAVGWSSSKHTGECVDFFAFGPGSEAVPPFIKNYEVFGLVASALGLNT